MMGVAVLISGNSVGRKQIFTLNQLRNISGKWVEVLLFILVPSIKLTALCMVGKCFTPELSSKKQLLLSLWLSHYLAPAGLTLSSLLMGGIMGGWGVPLCVPGRDVFLASMLRRGKSSPETTSGMRSWCEGEPCSVCDGKFEMWQITAIWNSDKRVSWWQKFDTWHHRMTSYSCDGIESQETGWDHWENTYRFKKKEKKKMKFKEWVWGHSVQGWMVWEKRKNKQNDRKRGTRETNRLEKQKQTTPHRSPNMVISCVSCPKNGMSRWDFIVGFGPNEAHY